MAADADDLPPFLKLNQADMSAWREHPVTRDFLGWLEWEEGRGREATIALIREKRYDEAQRLVGRIETIDSIRVFAHRTDAPAAQPDEVFIDPAMRRSLLERKRPHDL